MNPRRKLKIEMVAAAILVVGMAYYLPPIDQIVAHPTVSSVLGVIALIFYTLLFVERWKRL